MCRLMFPRGLWISLLMRCWLVGLLLLVVLWMWLRCLNCLRGLLLLFRLSLVSGGLVLCLIRVRTVIGVRLNRLARLFVLLWRCVNVVVGILIFVGRLMVLCRLLVLNGISCWSLVLSYGGKGRGMMNDFGLGMWYVSWVCCW